MSAFSLSDRLGWGWGVALCLRSRFLTDWGGGWGDSVMFAFSLSGMVTVTSVSREASTEGIALCLRSRFLTYSG